MGSATRKNRKCHNCRGNGQVAVNVKEPYIIKNGSEERVEMRDGSKLVECTYCHGSGEL
jgi:RecJ-like exonuclease